MAAGFVLGGRAEPTAAADRGRSTLMREMKSSPRPRRLSFVVPEARVGRIDRMNPGSVDFGVVGPMHARLPEEHQIALLGHTVAVATRSALLSATGQSI